MKPIKTEVGKRIKDIRERGNYSMSDFGKLLNDSSRGTVNNWEKGKRTPNNEILEKIAILGNTTVDRILYGDMKEYLFQLAKQNLHIEMNDQMTVMILLMGRLKNLTYQNEVEWLELISNVLKSTTFLPAYLVYIPVMGADNLYTAHVQMPNEIEQSECRGKEIPLFYAFREISENLLHIIPFPLNANKEELFFRGIEHIVCENKGEYFARNFKHIGMKKENTRLLFYGIDRQSLAENFKMYKYDKESGRYEEIKGEETDYYDLFVEEAKKEILKLREECQ